MLRKIMLVFITTSIILISGCSWKNSRPMEEKDYDALPPLSEPLKFNDFDLAEALNEAQAQIEAHSIFWRAPQYPETLAIFQKYGLAPKQDAVFLRKSVLINFFAFLSVPESQIPQWAWDLSGRDTGYSFINEVYQRVVKEPQYGHLQEPERKEALLKFMIGDGEKGTGLIGAIGDPFTWYVSASAAKRGYWKELMGEYIGIGVSIGLGEERRYVIKKVVEGSPANKAGIRVGDTILAIDKKSPLKSSREQVSDYFYGPAGTSVVLTIKTIDGAIKDIKVVRENIRERYVFSWPGVDLPGGRGNTSELLPFSPPLRDKHGREVKDIIYLKLKCFKPYVIDDVRTILTSLNLREYSGIIIDLRDNSGGYGDKDMADFFLENEDVMAIEVFNDGAKKNYSQDKEDLATEITVAVLIGPKTQFFLGTWSAAEVFAAALRDNGRATLIGERTPGKGTAVHYSELKRGDYGAIIIGVLIWLTPAGEWIEGRDMDKDGYYESGGLKPDIYVAWTDDDYRKHDQDQDYDPTIFEAVEFLRKSNK